MDPVRALRERAALTQHSLARAAGTSQPAIAAYEAGRKSPTMDTLQRLASAVGLHATIEYTTPLTREERRSLALHFAIARRLAADPAAVLALARQNLARMRAHGGPEHRLLREWETALDRPIDALLPALTDPREWARELRQVTPFAGVLSVGERAAVYRRFADDERRAS